MNKANEPAAPVDLHRVTKALLAITGVGIAASGLVINPWVGRWYRSDMIPYADVMAGYFQWAMGLGALLTISAFLLPRLTSPIWTNLTLLLITVSGFIMGDRLLLARFGLPLWKPDVNMHYKHRPNAIRAWGPKFNHQPIRINSHGYHDDEFPVEKPAGEFRAVVLGNSITMGHGVAHEVTFSNQLEAMLQAQSDTSSSFQIINAGVQGYSTFQEFHAFRAALRLSPDFVVVAFCMNDVTEPFLVDERFGGSGIDYHRVTQAANPVTGFLLNETGIGRYIQRVQDRRKTLTEEQARKTLTEEQAREEFTVNELAARPREDELFREPWRITLEYLSDIYELAGENDLPVVLLIFPFTFQLGQPDLLEPQKILVDHAAAARVNVLDFTEVFTELVFNPDNQLEPLSEMERIRTFFIDADHYTERGHQVVASRLLDYVESHNIVRRR